MEEIDLNELLNYYKERITIIIAIVAGVCLLGCIYGLVIQKPKYQSYTTVILGSSESSQSSAITQSDVNLNRNLVDTYAQIVKSRRVLTPVIDELKLDIAYEDLYNKIGVTALNNTEIIKITVTDRDAIMAKNIANVTAENFTESVTELYNMNNVNVLDEAIQAEKPFNISVVKQVVIYFAIGIIMAIGIIFVVFYFDRTIKTVEQVEQKIKLPILGSVQELTAASMKGGKK